MIKVAIVEDITELRHLWTDILNNTEGYVCVGSFSNATDAVQKLPVLSADVILMDIHLSETESGIDVIKKIRSQCLDSQFLMFTIFQDDESIFHSLKAGATGYILKNTSPTKVLDAIKELHEGGSPMSAGIARRVIGHFNPKPTPQYPSKIDQLSPKELHILELLAKGKLYKEIADDTQITIGMIKQNLHAIYKKLEVSNRTEAAIKYNDR
jgi:DNA-binding NarL/FixJ family response regulator